MKKFFSFLFSVLLCFSCVSCAGGIVPTEESSETETRAEPLFVGYAERDFTPSKPGGQMPGASYLLVAKRVELPLSASAVAFECGDDSLILISMDILRFASADAASMRERITAATGVPGENILTVATHTHTSIALNVKYNLCDPAVETFDYATAMAVEAATTAWNTRERAKMGSGTATLSGYSFCREAYLTDGKVKTWPTNASKIDRLISTPDQSVNVIRVDNLEGKVKAFVVNYANHPDTTPDGGYNSDWPGYMRKVLKEEYGEDLVVVFLNGANGDVNHYDYLNSTKGDREYKSIGTALAHKVIELSDTIRTDEEFPALKASSKVYEAPMRTITQEHLDWARQKMELIENGGSVSSLDKKFAVEYTTHDYSQYGSTYEIEIQTLVLGDFAMVCLPCQPYSEIGHKIREQSPYENTMVVSLANGEFGYVTPDSLLGTDSYGARFSIYTSRSGEGTADLLIDNSLAMLREMKQ